MSSRLMRPREVPPGCGPLKAADISKRMAGPLPGGAAADGARTAMGLLADELLAVLTDILKALVSAQADDFDHVAQGVSVLSTTNASSAVAGPASAAAGAPANGLPRL